MARRVRSVPTAQDYIPTPSLEELLQYGERVRAEARKAIRNIRQIVHEGRKIRAEAVRLSAELNWQATAPVMRLPPR